MPPVGHALRPIVVPFTREHVEIGDPAIVRILRAAQLLVGALAFVVAMNLAILLIHITARD